MGSTKQFLTRAIAWVVTVSLLATSCAPSQKSSSETNSSQPEANPNVFATPWAGRSRAYPQIGDLVKTIGTDPAKQLAYVTHEIDFEPYEGVLRGPIGTVWAAAGNSTDKSLLLAAMLKVSDASESLRFASCSLSADQAGQLVDHWASRQQVTQQAAASISIRPNDQIVAEGSDEQTASEVRQALDTLNTLVETTTAQAGELAAKLRADNVALGDNSRETLMSATTHHVWLQLQQQGRWVDFDPVVGEVGKQLCAPEQTMAQLPEDWYHHIGIGVRVETRTNGQVESHYALQTGWRTSDLVGSTIGFTFAEPFALGQVPHTSAPSGYRAYTPVLAIDHQLGVGKPIVLPTPTQVKHGIVGETGAAITGAAAALGNIGAPSTPVSPSSTAASQPSLPEVTGVWLSFDVRAPGGYRKIVEEPVFDRIGIAQRVILGAKSAPLGVLAREGGEYVALSRFWSITPWTGEVNAPPANADISPGSRDLGGVFASLAATGREFYQLRNTLVQLNAMKCAMTGPAIGVLAWSDSGATFDRLYEPVSISNGIQGAAAVPKGVLWGVASLQAERYALLALTQPASLGDPRNAETDDVATVFDLSKTSGIPIAAFRPSAADTVLSVQTSSEARLRIFGELSEGSVVLAPSREVVIAGVPSYGWWSVSAQSGMVQDERPDGTHGAGESAILEGETVEEIPAAIRFRNAIGKLYCKAGQAVGWVSGLVGIGMTIQQFMNVMRLRSWQELQAYARDHRIDQAIAGALVSSGLAWIGFEPTMGFFTGLECRDGLLIKTRPSAFEKIKFWRGGRWELKNVGRTKDGTRLWE